jgi:PhzF family phenazine biosynthesis protein
MAEQGSQAQELPFITLDVFTTTKFKGNPLAVVTIPANLPSPPTQAQKQAIAREFNLSETVFVHDVDPTSGNDTNQRKIDIFLVNAEIPFAGHPTIGAAVSLLPLGVRTVVAKAGPIAITQTGPRAVEASIPHDVRIHAKRLHQLSDDLTPTLDLSPDPIIRQAELNAPIVSIVNGMTFLLIELPSLDHLSRVNLNPSSLAPGELLDEGWRKSFLGRYHFVRTGGSSTGDVVTLRTRLVEPTLEDPATGSAASALCSYLSLTSGRGDGLTRYEVTQGVEMGRESNIVINVGVKGGKVETVTLAGTATQVMRGFVSL